MTLITRINCGSSVYVASDNQINKHDNFKASEDPCCKLKELPIRPGVIGTAGLIMENKRLILDDILDFIKDNNLKSIEDIIYGINSVVDPITIENKHFVYLISQIFNNNINNYTFIKSKNELLISTIYPESQINHHYLIDLLNFYMGLDIKDIANSQEWMGIIRSLFWTNKIDFNTNYMHYLNYQTYFDDEDWRIYSKPYTLLLFLMIKNSLDYSNIETISENEWKLLLIQFYEFAVDTSTNLYKNNPDNSIPFYSVGTCNHIYKLDINGSINEIHLSSPC